MAIKERKPIQKGREKYIKPDQFLFLSTQNLVKEKYYNYARTQKGKLRRYINN